MYLMQEFLVYFEIDIPPEFLRPKLRPGEPGKEPVAQLYEDEAAAAKPLIEQGYLRRVWREPGTKNHWAHWYAPNADFIHLAYGSFPINQAGFGKATVHPLAINSNDPGLRAPGWAMLPDIDAAERMYEVLKTRQGAATPPQH